MTSKKRKISSLIFVLILVVFMSSICVFLVKGESTNSKNSYNVAVKEATDDFYVNDFANIFTQEQKADMMSKAINFNDIYSGIQVVITTVESLNDIVLDSKKLENYSIEEIAYSMFDEYGIGYDDMGVLVLFSVGDREVKIETGKKMQAYITDSLSGRILDDYGMDYFIDDKFADGLIAVQSALIEQIQKRVPKDWNSQSKLLSSNVNSIETENINSLNYSGEENEKSDSVPFFVVVLTICFLLFILIVPFLSIINRYKNKIDSLEEKSKETLTSQKISFESKLKENEENHAKNLDAKELVIKKLQNDILDNYTHIKQLNKNIETLKEKLMRIQKLHPEFDFENEVFEMIESEYKAEAYEVDTSIANVLNYEASKDNIKVFDEAILLYNKKSKEVKKYIVSDISKLQDLYKKSVSLKDEFEKMEREKKDKEIANEVYNYIKNTLSKCPKGNRESYNELNKAHLKFLRLTSAQLKFFEDEDMISELKREFNLAKNDYLDFQAAFEAEKEISSIVNSIYTVDENDRNSLEKAMRCYKNLSVSQQAYFPDLLLSNLKRKLSVANADYKQKEYERSQRRMNSSSSYESLSRKSSYSNGHSGYSRHSGHGGRPSGGGAKRKF